ncbi:hypothetical protein GUITHDRAFT_156461, partial [Guillardia theta CCMP2712]
MQQEHVASNKRKRRRETGEERAKVEVEEEAPQASGQREAHQDHFVELDQLLCEKQKQLPKRNKDPHRKEEGEEGEQLRKKEEELRKEEEQLRKKEEQLRKKEKLRKKREQLRKEKEEELRKKEEAQLRKENLVLRQIPSSVERGMAWEESEAGLDRMGFCEQRKCFRLDGSYLSMDASHVSNQELFLYCREAFTKQQSFLRERVLEQGALGWIQGPPGTGKTTTTLAFCLSLDMKEWMVTFLRL